MKYCKHCGQEIDDDATFCPNCGTKVDDSNSENTSTSTSTSNSNSYHSYSSNRQPHKIHETDGGAVGVGILSFFVPIVGLIFFIIWKDTGPRYSKVAGIAALIGAILQFSTSFFKILETIFGIGFFGIF